MMDWLFMAGQALSLCGLAYGWYLVLIYCGYAGGPRVRDEHAMLLHHAARA